MLMHRCKSGRLISNDSIIAFVADNASDPSRYAINNGSLAYNDHNGFLRVIDLDLIPALDDTEEFFTPPTIRRRRRTQPVAMPESIKDAVDELDPKKFRHCVYDCMRSDCGYKQIVDTICVLINTIVNIKE